MAKSSIILQGHIESYQEKSYLYLPFDLTAGAGRLDIELSYSDQIGSDPRLSGGNTIDLGLFDERGITFLSAGFRGWSGSERHHIFITMGDATPGYLSGSLNLGTWNILLGLYKIAEHGCDYKVVIIISTSSTQPINFVIDSKRLVTRSNQLQTKFQDWYRGELHSHTYHSDGEHSPSGLVQLAVSRGMDFLAITDHNTTASLRDIDKMASPGLILIQGMEVTTFHGHFNCWSISDWVDFRVDQLDQMRQVIDAAKGLGALTSCSHPKPLGPGWDYPEVSNFDCVEVWNGPWTGLDEVSLHYWMELIESGRQIPAVGGSDYHRPGEVSGNMERNIGTPTNWVYVSGPLTPTSILAAIKAGHCSLSELPEGPFLELTCADPFHANEGDTLLYNGDMTATVRIFCWGGQGCILTILDHKGVLIQENITRDQTALQYHLNLRGSKYIRAELRTEEDWMRALTNPIYINQSKLTL